MVIGLGIDMIEVERIAAKINKNSGFREMLIFKGRDCLL
jgi:phosphopantetheinyl transferase (holo-ACP synthase)